MRLPMFALILSTACSEPANHNGNPFAAPLSGVSTVFGTAADSKRRGQVEVIVKANFDAIRSEIRTGGGPVLTKAMDAAGIPDRDRPTRILQLQSDAGLYNQTPGALVTALMVYGS